MLIACGKLNHFPNIQSSETRHGQRKNQDYCISNSYILLQNIIKSGALNTLACKKYVQKYHCLHRVKPLITQRFSVTYIYLINLY